MVSEIFFCFDRFEFFYLRIGVKYVTIMILVGAVELVKGFQKHVTFALRVFAHNNKTISGNATATSTVSGDATNLIVFRS